MAAPTNIRQINRRDVLAALLRTGTATRSGLARATGLSQPTVGKIVDELLAEGILAATGNAATAAVARLGRPGHDLALSRARSCFLAIQLGVVRTRLAALPVAPPRHDHWDQTVPTPRSLKAWINAIATPARKLITPATKAVLISVPGVLDHVTGRSLLSPNLRWLEGQNIAEAIENALGLPVHAVQETRCLALGHYAIDRSTESFLLVDFGTGVGSAPVLHGRLLQGQLPLSGELGHTPVPGNPLKCGCGGTGCLETLVGREHLLATLGIDSSNWYAGWTKAMTTLEPNALPVRFRQALDAAALGIAGALNVLGLNHVIVTGFLSDLPEPAMQILRSRIQSTAVAGRFGTVHTSTAPRRRLAGLASVGIDRVLAPDPANDMPRI